MLGRDDAVIHERLRVSIKHWAKSGTGCQLTFNLSHYLSTRHRRFDVAMSNYHYDESGVMASYFVVSVLFIILVPATFSLFSSFKRSFKSLASKSPPPEEILTRLCDVFIGGILTSESSSDWVSVPAMCGPTSADTQAGERYITEAENIKVVRGLWTFAGVLSVERSAQGHLCRCWLGCLSLPGYTRFFNGFGF